MSLVRRPGASTPARSAFTGFRFSREVIVFSVRWYLRFGLPYRDVEELLAERGIDVDHVTVHRWCAASRRCWPTPPGSAGTGSAIAGTWT
jgi:transposase-like protein